MNKNFILYSLPMLVISAVFLPSYVEGNSVGAPVLPNPIKYNTIPELISGITQAILLVIAVVGGLMLAIAGVLFTISGGNEQRLRTARSAFWYGVVGLAIALGGMGFIAVITQTIT